MAATAGNLTSLERGPFLGPMAELFNALQHGSAPLAASLLLSGLVVMLSLVPLGAARSQADFSMADLAAPRAMFERLPAWGRRASWAHQNCFEAFTLHAPACLLALVAGVSAPIAMAAAWLHPLLRINHLHRGLRGQRAAPARNGMLGVRSSNVQRHPLSRGAQSRAAAMRRSLNRRTAA